MRTKKPSGYILHESQDRVVIATLDSDNVKTGNMIQVWILPVKENPLAAIKAGTDSVVCGDCKYAGGHGCYVRVEHAPLGIWKAYKRGSYGHLSLRSYPSVFGKRRVRLGAYGDPYFIPYYVVQAICGTCERWTGYTHQWSRADASWLKSFCMASVDSEHEARLANANGWRYFRTSSDTETHTGEILCPASEEAGHRTQCIKCCLCDGTRFPWDARADIVIKVHGAKTPRAIAAMELVQIGA